MDETVRIGKRFTIVIPRAIRRKLGLREGMVSRVEVNQGQIILTPDKEDPFMELARVMKPVRYTPAMGRKAEKWMLEHLVDKDEWGEPKSARRRH